MKKIVLTQEEWDRHLHLLNSQAAQIRLLLEHLELLYRPRLIVPAPLNNQNVPPVTVIT